MRIEIDDPAAFWAQADEPQPHWEVPDSETSIRRVKSSIAPSPFKNLYAPEAARIATTVRWIPGKPIVFYDSRVNIELHVTLTRAVPSQHGVWLYWDRAAAQRKSL